jgi:hypothetical protein
MATANLVLRFVVELVGMVFFGQDAANAIRATAGRGN